MPSTKHIRCDPCDKDILATNYRRHMRNKHQEERLSDFPKQCPYCQSPKRNTNLARHKAICKSRPGIYLEEEELNNHQERCSLCHQIISSPHYRRHFRMCKYKVEKEKLRRQKEMRKLMNFSVKDN